jgi:hypothetical protein
MATVAASLFLVANPMSLFSSFLLMAAASVVDSYLVASLTPGTEVSEGKVSDLTIQTCTVGSAINKGYGKVRITGNIIWGTKFTEHIKKTTSFSGGKGGGGAKTTTTTYTYSASFAIALANGPIVGVSDVWADGNSISLSDLDYRVYTGTETQLPDEFMEAIEGAGKVPAYRGLAYIVFRNMVLTDYGNRIPTFSFVVEFPKNDLKEIVEEISEEAGLVLQQDINADALAGQRVEGFLRSGSKTFREQMEELRVVHIFEGAERFGKLVFAPRDFSRVLAVSSGEIGAYENKGTDEPIQVSTKYDMQLPKRLTISYLSKDNDYQSGSQTGYRQLTGALSEENVSTSIVMTDSAAKSVAEMRLYELWMARTSYEFKLPMKYGYVLPGDVLQLSMPNETGTQLVVVTKSNFGRPGLNVISANNVNAANYSLVTRPVDEVPETIVTVPSEVFAYILDVPKVPQDTSSSDDYVYIAIGAKDFYGANVYRSYDDGISYEHQLTFTGAAVFGEALTVLDVANPCYTDNGHTVDVKLTAGSLESHSWQEVLNYANAAVLGEEVVQFKNAELIAEDTYRLSGLLRGRNGTEHQVGSHKVGERFVLITTSGISAFPVAKEDWYTNVKLRIGPRNSSVLNDNYKDYEFIPQAVNYKPWSVCSLKVSWQEDNCLVSWKRRTRKNGAWKDYADVPLSETTEAYEVEILDSSDGVLRTEGMGTPSFLYTKEMQEKDKDFYKARIYQISDSRGRGIGKDVIL